MEIVGAVASIAALIELATTVIGYIKNTKEGGEERKKLLREASGTLNFLVLLKNQAEEREWANTLRVIVLPNGPAEQFRIALERLASKLYTVGGIRSAGKTLTWYFQKGEINEILSIIERQKSLFVLALENDHIALTEAIMNLVVEVNQKLNLMHLDQKSFILGQENRTRDKESQEILDWLSPLNFWTKQNDTVQRREPGTGEWLLNDPRFIKWLDGTNRILWCPGEPGVGKTILASVVINHLEQTFHHDNTVGIAYIYFNYKNQYTTVDLLGSLLKQMVERKTDISKEIREFHTKNCRRRTPAVISEMSTLLQSETHPLSSLFIVLDAFDECPESGDIRTNVLSELKKLRPTLRLLVTARPHIVSVRKIFQDAVRLDIRASEKDIQKYLEGRIQKVDRLRKLDPVFRETIKGAIAKKAQGMFLLAELHVNALSQEFSIAEIRVALERLPEELNTSYEDVMRRIFGQNQKAVDIAKRLLGWLTYAKEPLETATLQHALAVIPDSTKFDEEALMDVEDLISVCAGIVIIDPQSGIIRMVHYTAQDYIEHIRDMNLPPQIDIAKTCLTYLGFDVYDDPCLDAYSLEKRLEQYKLSRYAALYWADHARGNAEYEILPAIFRTFLSFGKRESVGQIQLYSKSTWRCFRNPIGSSLLHIAAGNGLEKICRSLLYGGYKENYRDISVFSVNRSIEELEEQIDVNALEHDGATALQLAAKNGHAEVVKLLLDVKANFEAEDEISQTPLSWAAENGHTETVKLLLDVKANCEAEDGRCRTPLSWAAGNGHVDVVKLLLDVKANFEAEDERCRTPLSWAAGNGHVEVVKSLLDVKANFEAEDERCRTPLSWAAGNGHTEVVKLLLDFKANFEAKDELYSRTSLSWAAGNGHAEVVKLLLDVKANFESEDERSRTPLSWAAVNGHSEVVKLLLDVNASFEAEDKLDARTPLSWAAGNGHPEVVRLLLDIKANFEAEDQYGLTPLSWAAGNGHTEVVKLLLDVKANFEAEDKICRTPLSWATDNGHAEVMKLLLEVKAKFKAEDKCYGLTPLSWAAGYGLAEMAKLLLEIKANFETEI